MMVTTAPGPGVTFEMGGTPSLNTEARAVAWDLMVGFFTDHLPPV
jgi:hypothetical protein